MFFPFPQKPSDCVNHFDIKVSVVMNSQKNCFYFSFHVLVTLSIVKAVYENNITKEHVAGLVLAWTTEMYGCISLHSDLFLHPLAQMEYVCEQKNQL